VRRLVDGPLGRVGKVLFKYRPFVITVAAVLLIVLLVPGRSPSGTSNGPPGSGLAPSGGTAPVASLASLESATTTTSTTQARVPAGHYGAASVGTSAALSAPNCNRSTGQVKIPTIYAPPCVAPFPQGANNGGATWKGVTANTIKMVMYLPSPGPDQAATNSTGLTETNADEIAQMQGVIKILEQHVDLYGRKIQVVPYVSTCAQEPCSAQTNADAIQVADQIKPFLSLDVSPSLDSYDLDVAQRRVISLTDGNWDESVYQKAAPYLWGIYDNQHIISALTGYICDRLWGHKAAYAGSAYTQDVRKIGLLYGTSTVTSADLSDLNAGLARCGAKFADKVAIDDGDAAAGSQQAQTAIAQFQSEGITTIVPYTDLVIPILLGATTDATKQGYFPEWVANPVGYVDDALEATYMSPAQWKHAFGITSVSPPITPLQDDQNGAGLWYWQYGSAPPGSELDLNQVMISMMSIINGLSLAGPDLTPATYKAAQFAVPPRGGAFIGGAATIATAYGNQGHVWPKPSYASISDFAEIFWSASATCEGPTGKTEHGCYIYPSGAKRHFWNHWPSGEPKYFTNASNQITYFSGGGPTKERAPDYPKQCYYNCS